MAIPVVSDGIRAALLPATRDLFAVARNGDVRLRSWLAGRDLNRSIHRLSGKREVLELESVTAVGRVQRVEQLGLATCACQGQRCEELTGASVHLERRGSERNPERAR